MTQILREPEWESVLQTAKTSYYKLVLIVGSAGSGKSKMLKAISDSYGFGRLNLGEELSRRLLELPKNDRPMEAESSAISLVEDIGSHRVAIDNTEILFEAPIQLNPLALLKKLSLSRVIVATWTGSCDESHLEYFQALETTEAEL